MFAWTKLTRVELRLNYGTSRPLVTRRRAALPLGLLAFALLAGCGEQPRQERHEVLLGVVEGLRPEMGQLAVRAAGYRAEQDGEQSVSCLLTSDAEVYINDKFSSPDEIDVGDTIELVGYRDLKSRTERFLVAFARIRRIEPPPPLPDLPPTAKPTDRPKES